MKRVLITQWAGQARDEVCKLFDFSAAGRKVGMLMTIDGSNDDLISIDSVDKYTFTESDAGDLPDLNVNDDEAEEEEVSDNDTDEGGGVGGGARKGGAGAGRGDAVPVSRML